MAHALMDNQREAGITGRVYAISQDDYFRVSTPLRVAARSADELELSGHVTFLEGSSVPSSLIHASDPEVARDRAAYLANRIISESRESLLHKTVAALDTVDLVYLDSLHYESFQMSEIMAVVGKLGRGSIFIDDVLRAKRYRELKKVLKDAAGLRLNWHGMRNYIQTGLGVYEVPRLLHAFDSSRYSQLRVFKMKGNFLLVAEITLNPTYEPLNAHWSAWYSPMELDELVARYEYGPGPGQGALAGNGRIAEYLKDPHKFSWRGDVLAGRRPRVTPATARRLPVRE